MLDHLYPESIETSGAFLRLALKEIAGYDLPYNPVTYAVWYEFAAGRNAELNDEIHAHKKNKEQITAEMVSAWFKTYIANEQFILAEQKTQELKSIIAEMSAYLGDSGSRLDDRGQQLEAYADQLKKKPSIEQVMTISRGIMTKTRDMILDGQSLKKEMDDTMSEIHALKKELEGVKQAAKTDMLTGLLNRRGLEMTMKKAMERAIRTSNTLTVIISDIDHFKRINDTYGHLIGDNVLKMLAKLLQEHIKGKDIAARFGGEEFLLVLPDTALKGAFVLAEQIRLKLKSMRWRTKSGEPMGAITMSLGVAEFRAKDTLDSLIERADAALYQAKSCGRNRTVTELDIEQA